MVMKNKGHTNCSSTILMVPLLYTGANRFYFTSNSIANYSLVLVFIKYLLCIKLCVVDYIVKDLTSSGRAHTPLHNSYSYKVKFCNYRIEGTSKVFISLEFYCIVYA